MFGMGMPGMGGMGGLGMPQHNAETTAIPDTAEKVQIAPLALVKMLKHCKSLMLDVTQQDRQIRGAFRSDGHYAGRIRG